MRRVERILKALPITGYLFRIVQNVQSIFCRLFEAGVFVVVKDDRRKIDPDGDESLQVSFRKIPLRAQ